MIIRRLSIVLFPYCLILFSCGNDYNKSDNGNLSTIPEIISKNPISQNFIQCNLIKRIPFVSDNYAIDSAGDFDIDSKGNTYITDGFSREIMKFDKTGKFTKKIGGRGQGPNEFESIGYLSIFNDKMYVLNLMQFIKILTLDGEYIESITLSSGMHREFYFDNQLIYSSNYRPTLDIQREITTIESFNLSGTKIRELLKFEKGKYEHWYFAPQTAYAIHNGSFYFPESPDKYKIVKHDANGNPLLVFGREYERIPYTEAAKRVFFNRYERSILAGSKLKELDRYPPVIRKILVDSKGYIWVLYGEINLDNGNSNLKTFVDIFDSDGNWIQNLELEDFLRNSKVTGDYLLSPSTKADEFGSRSLNIYKIKYNF